MTFEQHDDGGDVDLSVLGSGKELGERAQASSHQHGSAEKAADSQQQALAIPGALSIAEAEVEDEDTKLARTSLHSEVQLKYDATAAALHAARTAGGDEQLVEALPQSPHRAFAHSIPCWGGFKPRCET